MSKYVFNNISITCLRDKNTTEIQVEILHHIGLGADARSEEGRSKQIHGPTLPPVAALSEFRKNKYHIIRYTIYIEIGK